MTKKAIGKDNSGFSLVELIIAVAILAFVIGPILYSFVVSNRIANRSLTIGDATLVSRNVIETIRADGIGEVRSYVTAGASPFGGNIDASYPGHNVDNPDSGVFEFLVRGIPAGTLENMNIGASADMTYDAIVRIDANAYREVVCPGGVVHPPDYITICSGGELLPGLNRLPISEYKPMDGMFIQDSNPLADPDVQVIDDLIDLSGLTAADIVGKYNRTIELKAYRDGVDTVVEVKYIYTFPPYAVESDDPANPNPPIVYEYPEIYRDTYSPTYPLVIYMYYRPYYGDPGVIRDVINIYNLNTLDLSVFAIKQMPLDAPADPASDPAFAMRESTYQALINRIVHINEYGNNSGHTKVYTNFRQDFSDGSPNPTGLSAANVIQRFCNGSPLSYTTTENAFFFELVSRSERDRMHLIHVEVYREWSPTAELMLEFDATHLE